ncbi:MAG: hypothetical protein KAH23_05785 [Kiritimatiellae bacterium]|nr:hypothetical protein [Kiritimatiellia bacterium]
MVLISYFFNRFLLLVLFSALCFTLSACSDRKDEVAVAKEKEDKSTVVHPVGVNEAGKQIQVMMMRLDVLKRTFAEDLRNLGELQNKAIKVTPELAAMEKEYIAERQVFVDRLNGWSGIKEKVEKKDILREESLLLSEQMRSVISEIRKSKDESKIKVLGEKLASLKKELRNSHKNSGEAQAEISKLQADLRKNHPEMRSEHLRLQEKHGLLYAGRINVIPEIVALRKLQKERQEEIKKLEIDVMTFRTNLGRVGAEGDVKKEAISG